MGDVIVAFGGLYQLRSVSLACELPG